ncbi:MAG: hypothetical protein JXQ75_05195 [Phycisphaerae bacterium]|nr:hypothetical protein [Phycisphaerae bacterium]
MKAIHRPKKTLFLASLLPAMMLAVSGCDEDRAPMDILVETIGNFMKGLIDVGAALFLGN